jgi:hypothetical protein
MALETDLNVPPYHDDYDPAKNYYRILYRPATAVQARELTQQQTILQTQIERFGDHIFKDGSIVDGVGILYYPNTHFIAVEDTFSYANGSSANSIFPTSLTTNASIQYLLTNSQDSNNAVRAVIKIAKDGTKENANNTFRETNRFYLDYTFTGTDLDGNDINRFAPGDTVYIYNENQNKFGTLDANNLVYTVNALSSNSVFDADGNAYLIGCTDGTIYQKGFFSTVNKQTIAVRDFSTNVTGYVVGFDTTESIVDENEDETLLDNALGYPNENAPGAHRLKLDPTLVSKTRTDTANNKNFFAIVEFDGQEPTEQKDQPVYNVLEQQLARKTYEESGDYVVKPFQIEAIKNEANTQSFYYEVSSGIGYVRGFRIEKIGATKVETSRATTTEIAQNQIISANYGNYVICDEYLGAFDFESLAEVTLYDAAQNAISEYEGSSASPTGSVVGKANVRAISYFYGTKGLPTCQYLIYLFNIRMNSGKSFSSDVKSIYLNGSSGYAKADIVLENDLALLKDSDKSSLILDSGLKAVKRLTNNTGIGDTSFVFDEVKTATLAITGNTSVTIDTPATGGINRLNASVGSTITGTNLNDYNIYVSANAYTANLTGTISYSSGNVQIVGTGTNFTSALKEGSLIRVYNTSTQYIRRVVSVTNTTHITIDSSIAATNASASVAEYFVTGSPLPLTSVYINSNTSFTAVLGKVIDSGTQTVYCQYPVNRTQAKEIPKIINKDIYVKIDCSNNTTNTVGPWDLGLCDIHKVKNIYLGTTYANTNPDRLSWFIVDTGQRDDFYDHGRLIIKPEYAAQVNSSIKMLVVLDYFTSNTAAGAGFFSVDSYPIDDANTANTNAIQTIDTPLYNGRDLRNYVDFRARKYDDANSSTTIAGATINPSVSNTSFNVSASGQHLIAPDEIFTADYEFYLPRMDLITIDPVGNFNIINGIPSTFPIMPFVENDQSVIAEAFVPAYPSATKREFDQYKNASNLIKINLKTNRRYTMKDIGGLDDRIKKLEYYTVLNMLEQQAKDVTIPDANGLNRFKNGIFADPFNSHQLGNVSDLEYKIAIDMKDHVARPYYDKHDVDFQFVSANSANVQRTGPLITLPYSDNDYIKQRFATKIRNTTESVWQWNGLINLYPSLDFFRDETTVPNVNVNLDLSAPWEAFAQSPFAQMYGDWRDVSSEVINTSFGDWQVAEGPVRNASNWVGTLGQIARATRDVITTSQTTQERMLNQLSVNTTQQNIDLGSYVRDITIQPYMRSRIVAFVAYNMKPNTTLHAFFDDTNVDAYCAPGVLSGSTTFAEGLEDNIVRQTGAFGDQLISDANGFVCGVFRIPAQTFRTGDRIFQITNVSDLTIGADAKITISKATYTADNVSVTRGSTTLNVRQPEVSFTQTALSRTLTSQTITQEEGYWDPICQSFSITGIPEQVSGIFLSKVGVYFYSKDNTLGCQLYICEMENNLPNQNRIIGKAYLPAASINTSTNASTETIFTLEYPVYLLTNNDYAFIVQPDGNSPEYNIWVGETGGIDVATNEQVFSNPYSGIMFISANRKTWTPVQKEDMKFNLYRAKFTITSVGNAIFKNEDDENISVNGFTKANTDLSINVGDIVYTVNGSISTQNTTNIVANTLTTKVYGRVQYVDEAAGKIFLDSSTANSTSYFSNTTNPIIAIYRSPDISNTSYINANTLISYANVVTLDNLKYHAVVPKFGTLEPSKTQLSYSFKGTSNTNIQDTVYQTVINNTEYSYSDNERHSMSLSNEIASLSSNKSSTFKVDLVSSSDFVSPVINLSKKSMFFIENKINNDLTNEHTRYGNSMTKYISKQIVLADGQEAEDLKVYLTAYRPYNTDITLYAKFLNKQDPEIFDEKVWTKLNYLNDGNLTYSSSTDKTNYIEYEFGVPSYDANTITSIPQSAFANTNVDTYSPLTGTISISNNSNIVTGTGTNFTSDLTVGDRIRLVASNYFAIRTVTNISNTTSLTLDQGVETTNSAALYYVFASTGNDGIVEYNNSANSRFIGYKNVALKIVLTSSNPVTIPLLNDVRLICLQI